MIDDSTYRCILAGDGRVFCEDKQIAVATMLKRGSDRYYVSFWGTFRSGGVRPVVYKCRRRARPWVPLLCLVGLVGLALGLAAALYFLGDVRVSLP